MTFYLFIMYSLYHLFSPIKHPEHITKALSVRQPTTNTIFFYHMQAESQVSK